MKSIILLCTILALLTPAHVFASDSSTRFALQQQWQVQQAQQREEDARFKAAEAEAAKAIAATARKADAQKDNLFYAR